MLLEDATQCHELIKTVHDHGHFSAKDTIKRIYDEGYFWPGLPNQVQSFVRACHTCLSVNASKFGYNPAVSVSACETFDHIQMDLISLPKTVKGSVAILTIVDVFTRYVVLRALPDKTATTVAKNLFEVFCNYGFPKIIQSDNGPEFSNSIVQALCNLTSSSQRFSTPYYPQCNGIVERMNGSALTVLRKLSQSEPNSWDEYLSLCQYYMNMKYNTLTNSKPFSLMYYRAPTPFKKFESVAITPLTPEQIISNMKFINKEIFPQLAKQQKLKQIKSNQFLDLSRINRAPLPVGSFVYYRNPSSTSKLDPSFIGPFKISNISHGRSYTLEDSSGNILPRSFHLSQLKPALTNAFSDIQYDAECIINHRGSPGNYEFLVKWKTLDTSLATWEPQSNITDKHLITKYFKKKTPSKRQPPVATSGGG